MLQQCYDNVTTMLQQCHDKVTTKPIRSGLLVAAVRACFVHHLNVLASSCPPWRPPVRVAVPHQSGSSRCFARTARLQQRRRTAPHDEAGALSGAGVGHEGHQHHAEREPCQGQVLPMKDTNIMQSENLVRGRCCP